MKNETEKEVIDYLSKIEKAMLNISGGKKEKSELSDLIDKIQSEREDTAKENCPICKDRAEKKLKDWGTWNGRIRKDKFRELAEDIISGKSTPSPQEKISCGEKIMKILGDLNEDSTPKEINVIKLWVQNQVHVLLKGTKSE